ncbi:MAG: hypothetical protein M3044_10480, partial [Thermoproteota archaeon]|nr:hypothetical protein [Thermoproteota archaeon]
PVGTKIEAIIPTTAIKSEIGKGGASLKVAAKFPSFKTLSAILLFELETSPDQELITNNGCAKTVFSNSV